MSKITHIELGPDDGAIVVRSGGVCEVYMAMPPDDDTVPATASQTAITKLALAAVDKDIQQALDKRIDKILAQPDDDAN